MNKRDKAYKQGKTERFKSLRGLITFEIRNAKSTFYNEKVRPTRCACPKAWWTKINNIIGKKRNGISLMDPDTDSPMTDKQPAIYINSFFSGLTKDYPELINEWLTHESMEDLPTITVDDVEKKLRNINTKKAPGPNDPDTRILKTFAKYFAIPLVDVFNESFTSGLFPKIWKTYKICGVPKTTLCSSVNELRPISLTSVLATVQESLACTLSK